MGYPQSDKMSTDGLDKSDEVRLRELGYKQELKRSISILSNIGLAFTILSIPSSLLPFLSFALDTGGNLEFFFCKKKDMSTYPKCMK